MQFELVGRDGIFQTLRGNTFCDTNYSRPPAKIKLVFQVLKYEIKKEVVILILLLNNTLERRLFLDNARNHFCRP